MAADPPNRMGTPEWVAERIAVCAARSKAEREARLDAIMTSPAAEGRSLAAFALALRLDLSAAEATALLGSAPQGLDTASAAQAWAASATLMDNSPRAVPLRVESLGVGDLAGV